MGICRIQVYPSFYNRMYRIYPNESNTNYDNRFRWLTKTKTWNNHKVERKNSKSKTKNREINHENRYYSPIK
jgi:hypothetical protein